MRLALYSSKYGFVSFAITELLLMLPTPVLPTHDIHVYLCIICKQLQTPVCATLNEIGSVNV